jgi:hypothetical protein
MKIREGLLDMAYYDKDCNKKKMVLHRSQLPDHLKNRDIKRLGFPRPETWSNDAQYHEDVYNKEVHRNLVDMDDPEVSQSVKGNIEVVVDLTDDDFHKLEINVKRNETRAEELKILRKKILEKDKATNNTERIDHNVLVLYLDNLSRAQFHRKMVELDKWLGQFTVEKDAELEATEFFRYHTISKSTFKSNNGLYYGQNAELNYDETMNVFHHFSKNGYVTGMFRDECDMNTPVFEEGLDRPQFYKWDHYGSTITCDTNYDRGNRRNMMLSSGRNSQSKRCLYGKSLVEIQMEYLTQFWEAYPDVRKFFRTSIMYAHEFSGELIKYADDDYVKLLQNFYEKGYLDDTQVIIVADHGAHFLTMRTNIFPDDSRRMENALPVLIHLTPKSIPDKNLQLIRANHQKFVNSHDFYASLKSLAVGGVASSSEVVDYSFIHEELPKRD